MPLFISRPLSLGHIHQQLFSSKPWLSDIIVGDAQASSSRISSVITTSGVILLLYRQKIKQAYVTGGFGQECMVIPTQSFVSDLKCLFA